MAWCITWTITIVLVIVVLLRILRWDDFDSWISNTAVLLLVGSLAGVVVVWANYDPHPGAPCLHSHQETSAIWISTGQYTGFAEPVTDNVCDLWGPKK